MLDPVPFPTGARRLVRALALLFPLAALAAAANSALTQKQELTAPDGASGDGFGSSVSVDGSTAVIGAAGKNVAYVFVQSGGVWSLQQELAAGGRSVSVKGDTALIGAQVLVRSGTTWTTQQQFLTPSDTAAGGFSASVSLSGDTAVIGAPDTDHSGAAFVFVRSGGVWRQQQEMIPSGGGFFVNSYYFGSSVSVDGDTTVIGAPGILEGAFVFVRSGGTWTQQQEVSGGAAGDRFGSSVSVSGDTALIGAAGAAYVFVRSGGAWSQQQKLVASDGTGGDLFGSSVSVSGNTAVVGAAGHNGGQGAVYVFVQSDGYWSLQQELAASDGAADDKFGTVSVSGNTALIGAPGHNGGQGAAYVFVSAELEAQTIGFAALPDRVFGSAPSTVSASASSGLPVSFNSQTTSVCTVSGSQVTLVAGGTCTIQATQAGNATYAAATPVNQSFQVTPEIQTISFGPLANQTLGVPPFTVSASASSGLPVSFNSQTTSFCRVSGLQVTLVTAGTCTIQATQAGNADYAATWTNQSFIIYPRPIITGVISAGAFGAYSAVAPGTWVEIYGSNLASTTSTWTLADFNGNNAPTSLGGVQVTIGGQATFIDYVSPGQVDAQLSSNIGPGSWQLIVTTAGAASAPVNATVNATEPGLLAPPSFKIGANQYVVAQFGDGTYVLPTGAIVGVSSRPAKPGETIVIYGIGFGSVVPNTAAGEIAPSSSRLFSPVQILFGQTRVQQLLYAGLAPYSVGLYQFNIVVPQVPDNDLVPVTFTLGGAAGAQTLYTAVHQ